MKYLYFNCCDFHFKVFPEANTLISQYLCMLSVKVIVNIFPLVHLRKTIITPQVYMNNIVLLSLEIVENCCCCFFFKPISPANIYTVGKQVL